MQARPEDPKEDFMNFSGAFTALVTPFRDGAIDEDAYRALIEWQIEQGIDGVVPCGTTGEAATMTHDEQGRVISICVDQVKGRVPVIAGAGSNNTKEAIQLTKLARDAGADAALQITPYYNKPTPGGVVAHFKAIAAECPIPMVLYNVPGRTGLNCLPETVARVAREVPEVKAVKEATGNLRQCAEVRELCGPDFALMSGDDFTVLPLLSVGGCGVISVVSNIAPKLMSQMCHAFAAKDTAKALELSLQLAPLSRAMFLETNPIPVKTALTYMGVTERTEFRLPLVPLLEEHKEPLQQALRNAGLMK
jgi:4-hydroxy-tetrahydrodipicolinate synthase